MNLYGYAGGDPVNRSDPFGLKDVFVGCRDVKDLGGFAQHCAVRVTNASTDETHELLNNDGRNQAGVASDEAEAEYTSWVKVDVPSGMSSDQFDAAVLGGAKAAAAAVNGHKYSPFGGSNSNRFVYNIITGAGGKVPWSAQNPLRGPAPGLCGGGAELNPGRIAPVLLSAARVLLGTTATTSECFVQSSNDGNSATTGGRMVFFAAFMAFLAVLIFAARIYLSVESEPSGVQFAFLPFLALPATLLCLMLLLATAPRVRVSRWSVVMPGMACLLFALPALGFPVNATHAEGGIWGVTALGLGFILIVGMQLVGVTRERL